MRLGPSTLCRRAPLILFPASCLLGSSSCTSGALLLELRFFPSAPFSFLLRLFPFSRQMHYGVNAVGRTLMPYQAALARVPCTSLLLSTCLAVDGSVADPRSKLHPSRFLWLIAACAGQEPSGTGSSSFLLPFFKISLFLAFLFSSSLPPYRGSVSYFCIPHRGIEVLCLAAFILILLAFLLLPLSLVSPCLHVIV